MTTLDDATVLGLAVQGFLARPPLDPLLDPVPPNEILRQRIEMSLYYLKSAGVLSEDEFTAVIQYVRDGKLPEPPTGPELLTTGIVLTSVVLYLHDVGPGSLFGGMLPALHHVVEAAVDGALHGGPTAALVCATIGAMHVLRGIKSVRADVSDIAVTGIKSGIKSSIHGIKA